MDITEQVGNYQFNKFNYMDSNLGTLSWANIKSALVYVFLTATLSILIYIIGIGDIFLISTKSLVNIGVMSLATGFVSVIKSFLTTSEGKFLGVVSVVPEK